MVDKTKLDATTLNKELPAFLFAGAIGTLLGELSLVLLFVLSHNVSHSSLGVLLF